MYADIFTYVRSGPHRGLYRLYVSATTYEVLEEELPEIRQAGDHRATEGGVGTRSNLLEGNRQDTTDQGVPDGQAQEEGAVNDERLDETTPRQLSLL
jgi:hypothetical protein